MDRAANLHNSLRTFTKFVCENGQVGSEVLIATTFDLLKHCPAAREAVLQFYAQLFDEFCAEFVSATCNRALPLDSGSFLARLKKQDKEATPAPTVARKSSVEGRKLSTDKVVGDEDSNTPASPPPAGQAADEQTTAEEEYENDGFSEQLITRVATSLKELCVPLKDEDGKPIKIGSWTIELLSKLCAKYSEIKARLAPPTTPMASRSEKLSETIAYWKGCPAVFLLIDITLKALEPPSRNTEFEVVIHKLLEKSPHTDWVCAYIITTVPIERATFSFENCIEYLSKSSASPLSVTCILSHLSEHNPQAIINSSKNNIPFLLQLCANSKPLLDVLSLEAAKKSM